MCLKLAALDSVLNYDCFKPLSIITAVFEIMETDSELKCIQKAANYRVYQPPLNLAKLSVICICCSLKLQWLFCGLKMCFM